MLQWINDRMKVIGWIFILPLALVFAVWGVQGIVDFTSRADRGLKVNGEDQNLERMRQDYQERIAQAARAYPDDVPADVKKRIQTSVVDEFVNAALVTQKVRDLRYVASDQDVLRAIHQVPVFQVAGQFNKDAYFSMLASRGLTPERFEAEQRELLRTETLERGLEISAFATPQELARAAALKGETRELAFAVLPIARFAAAAHPDETTVKAYWTAHPAEFMTPDSVHLNYVMLSVADVAREVSVDEAGLRAFYDTVKERFVTPEKRRARHILIQSGKDEAAAKKKADEVYALAAKPGADFAALAKQYSQDPGSAAQGGDLGLVERNGGFVPEFVNALFAMKAGEVSAPVKTQYGWHVIRLEAIEAGGSKSFEDARAELEPEYRKSEAERRFGERQEKLEQLAFENRGGLEPVAKALGVKIEDVPDFHKGLAGNALALNPKVLLAAFSADVLGGQNSSPIELSPGNVVVLRASDRHAPALKSFEVAHAAALEGARRAQAATDLQAAAKHLAEALAAGTGWTDLLKPYGTLAGGKGATPDAVRFEAPKFVSRAEAAGPDRPVVAAAFQAAAPAPGKPVSGTATYPNGDVGVYAVTGSKPGVVQGDGAVERRSVVSAYSQSEFAAYLAAMRAHATIRSGETLFE